MKTFAITLALLLASCSFAPAYANTTYKLVGMCTTSAAARALTEELKTPGQIVNAEVVLNCRPVSMTFTTAPPDGTTIEGPFTMYDGTVYDLYILPDDSTVLVERPGQGT